VRGVEALRRSHRDETGQRPARLEFLQVLGQRQVGELVAVVGEEGLVGAEVLAHGAEPLADVRMQPGFREGDGPVVDVAAGRLHDATALAHDEVGRLVRVVGAEEFLDQVAAVTEAEDEVLVAVVGIELHQVP
jgi:hypothetical protein